MDNDDKMKKSGDGPRDLVEQSKLVFLREIIDEFRRKQSQYDLAHEFARTKKNRSPIVPLVVLGISMLFLIGAVAVTFYIQEEGKKIAVNIKDFEDVNLKDVLDAARKNEQDMMEAKREAENITRSMEEEIETAQGAGRRQLDIIEADPLSPEDRDRKSRAVRRQEASRIARIQAAYQPRIAESQKKIDEIQKRIDAYDSRMLERAREQEEILNNQQRLAAIELENTRKYYEERIASLEDKNAKEIAALRNHEKEMIRVLQARHAREIEKLTLLYNPNVTDGEVLDLLREEPISGAQAGPIPGPYRELLSREGIMEREEFSSLRTNSAGFDRLAAEIGKVPYRNSIPPILRGLDLRHANLLRKYEKLWNGLADGIEKKNRIIADRDAGLASFNFALEHFLKTSRENGFVIDARKPEKIGVYMDKIRAIPDGTLGLVFRQDDEYIGRVRFRVDGGELFASVLELENAENPMKPFDKILIQEQ